MSEELRTNEELRELAKTFLAAREIALAAERHLLEAMEQRDELSLCLEGIVLEVGNDGQTFIVEQHLVV